jgi:hypothetical protein
MRRTEMMRSTRRSKVEDEKLMTVSVENPLVIKKTIYADTDYIKKKKV